MTDTTNLYDCLIEDLEISVRGRNTLIKLGCVTIGDLMDLEKDQLRPIWGAGQKTWNEIHDFQVEFRAPSPEQRKRLLAAMQQEFNFQVRVLLVYGATISRLECLQASYDKLELAYEEATAL